MTSRTQIEWTEYTWNPVTGCTKVSAGCKHCYAERMAFRLQKMGKPRYSEGFKVRLHHDLIAAPMNIKKPRMIFVCSMSDLFHESVPAEFIERVFNVMAYCKWHTFQVLTKRSDRLIEMKRDWSPPPNVWLGVSVENEEATHRICDLQQVDAAVRFLSCEPLLGPLKGLDLRGIDWVIVGGESGPGARPMKAEWVREILAKCRVEQVPFFFKQWGGVNKKATGRTLNGRTYDDMPQPQEM